MEEYIIRETEDFLSLSTLFNESGMGVKIEERMPERVIKMWRMDEAETGKLIAASTLEVRGGVFCLGDIAVRNDMHHRGYGRIMQKVVFDEARKRSITELWACAKEPEYYLHCGWKKSNWNEAPDIAVYCSFCGKRGITCFPEIMKYKL